MLTCSIIFLYEVAVVGQFWVADEEHVHLFSLRDGHVILGLWMVLLYFNRKQRLDVVGKFELLRTDK